MYETDPQKADIRHHFQYNFDRPQLQAAQPSDTPGGSGPDFNHAAEISVEHLNEDRHINGSVDNATPGDANGSANVSEQDLQMPPQGDELDTEMGGTV